MTTGFEAYTLYLSLKRHFEPGSKYDFNRYNGKTNASLSSFNNRKDRLFFLKLAKFHDVLGLLVANLSHDPKMWIGAIPYNAEALKRYDERVKTIQSLAYTVASKLPSGTKSDFNDFLRAKENEHPPLLKRYLVGDIPIEMLIVLDDLTSFTKSWKRIIGDDFIVAEVLEKIEKCRPFLEYDMEMVRTAIMKKYS